MNKVMAMPVECKKELSDIEQVVIQGDLSALSADQRVLYYRRVCDSLGLNPYTAPFAYIFLSGKLTLYAKKDATEQLRKINGISISGLESKLIDDIYIVKATATSKDGRTDQSTGVVTIGTLKGEAKANALMKAETKAKRRVTLSISGLGFVDETEIETIPNAKKVDVNLETGEISLQLIEQKPPIAPTKKHEIEETAPKISLEQAEYLDGLFCHCDPDYTVKVLDFLKKEYKVVSFSQLPATLYQRVLDSVVKNIEARSLTKGVE